MGIFIKKHPQGLMEINGNDMTSDEVYVDKLRINKVVYSKTIFTFDIVCYLTHALIRSKVNK